MAKQIKTRVNYQVTELVSNLLRQAALSHQKVKKTQPILVRLKAFGDNGLEMELVFWAENSWDINNYKSDIRLEIDRLFRQYGIVIPYPHRQIIFDKDNTETHEA